MMTASSAFKPVWLINLFLAACFLVGNLLLHGCAAPTILPPVIPTLGSTATQRSTITVTVTQSPSATPTRPPSATPSPTLLPSPTPTLLGGGSGQLAFHSGQQILLLDLLTSTRQQIATDVLSLPGSYFHLWSPDGQQMLYTTYSVSYRQHDLFSANSAGTDHRLLVTRPMNAFFPDWSPDGSQIVFTNLGELRQIYRMNADGSNLQALTSDGGQIAVWSPDGSQLAYLKPPYLALWLMNADGSQQQPLMRDYSVIQHIWSPDGKKLAMLSNHGSGWAVFVINADGTGEQQTSGIIAPVFSEEFGLSMSPDGQKLVYTDFRQGKSDLYVIALDGKGETRLTNDPANDYDPVWSPDGQWIAFVRQVNRIESNIWMIRPDGTDLRQLTDDREVLNRSPNWRPSFDQ